MNRICTGIVCVGSRAPSQARRSLLSGCETTVSCGRSSTGPPRRRAPGRRDGSEAGLRRFEASGASGREALLCPGAHVLHAECSCGWTGTRHTVDRTAAGDVPIRESGLVTAERCEKDWDTGTTSPATAAGARTADAARVRGRRRWSGRPRRARGGPGVRSHRRPGPTAASWGAEYAAGAAGCRGGHVSVR